MALLYSDPVFLEHETGSHPECAARLRAITARLDGSKVLDRFAAGEFEPARAAQVGRVHSAEHIAHIERFAQRGGGRIEADTTMSSRSFDVALQAAGAAIAAVDQVLSGAQQRAMCLVRPPGHHALADAPMGFCLFNNVAIAAAHALSEHGAERVLVVDWDVHHGNGTQDIFFDSDRVWFFSAHRSPFYPGTGAADETGSGAGLGATFNLPLRFGISRKEYIERFHTMLADAAAKSRPELLLVSAGFDAHGADPIGSLGLESEDFLELTGLVVEVAEQHCQGRVVSLLEGGYNLHALAESVEAHLDALVPG